MKRIVFFVAVCVVGCAGEDDGPSAFSEVSCNEGIFVADCVEPGAVAVCDDGQWRAASEVDCAALRARGEEECWESGDWPDHVWVARARFSCATGTVTCVGLSSDRPTGARLACTSGPTTPLRY